MQWILRAFLWYFIFITLRVLFVALLYYWEPGDMSALLCLGLAAVTGYLWSGHILIAYFVVFMMGRFIFKAIGILSAGSLASLSILLSWGIGHVWNLTDLKNYYKIVHTGVDIVKDVQFWDGFQFTTGLIFGIAYALFYYYRIEPERQG